MVERSRRCRKGREVAERRRTRSGGKEDEKNWWKGVGGAGKEENKCRIGGREVVERRGR